jgi:hypothetical protein
MVSLFSALRAASGDPPGFPLSESEIAFIEKIVRPMDLTGNAPDEAVSDDDE